MELFRCYWTNYLILLALGCQSPSEQKDLYNVEKLTGKQLANIYCGSCHLSPDPVLLDKKTWQESVLPHMSWRLGIPDSLVKPPMGHSMTEKFAIESAGIFPHQAQIPDHIWQKIVAYYLEASPEIPLSQTDKPTLQTGFPSFEIQSVRAENNAAGGITTLIRYHTGEDKIYLADMAQNLNIYDLKGTLEKKIPLRKVLTDIHFNPDNSAYLLSVGNIHPNDEEYGELLLMDPETNIQPVISGLKRPVHLTVSDLDQDGLEDMLICEFGYQTGRLSWYRQVEERVFVRNILMEVPGAIKTIVYDINKDGLPDIIALIAQGNEGVFGFINQGQGRFIQQILLQFSPVFGISDLVLNDINKDGAIDFILVNGDNADYSHILKNYHGVHIYLNDGEFQFKEAWFYPMYGATRVVCSDFDGDGDMDIAVSAFFPDFTSQTPESFNYLQNQRDIRPDSFQFLPFTFEESNDGRWMLMELADLEGNGKHDILLGSSTVLPLGRGHAFGEYWKERKINFLMLKSSR